jgi:hypothetical protein
MSCHISWEGHFAHIKTSSIPRKVRISGHGASSFPRVWEVSHARSHGWGVDSGLPHSPLRPAPSGPLVSLSTGVALRDFIPASPGRRLRPGRVGLGTSADRCLDSGPGRWPSATQRHHPIVWEEEARNGASGAKRKVSGASASHLWLIRDSPPPPSQ